MLFSTYINIIHPIYLPLCITLAKPRPVCFSASYCPRWNVSVFNTSSDSLMVEWGNVTTDPSTQVDYFIALTKEISGRGGKYKIISSVERFWKIEGLKKFTEYNMTVIAVDLQGIPCRSGELIRWTDESGKKVMGLV